MIALFLWMTVRPFAQHFESFYIAGGVFLLLVFLTLIYAFHHLPRLAVCLTILALIAVTLRFAADHWQVPSLISSAWRPVSSGSGGRRYTF
jgi:hypothetical protein